MVGDPKNREEAIIIESKGRRKAVKQIAGAVTALAAYHLLPAKWETPIIEQVFLPAHAQTSGTPSSVIENVQTVAHHSQPDTHIVHSTITHHLVATYTKVVTNTSLPASHPNASASTTYVNETVPNTTTPNVTVAGNHGDKIKVVVTNNVDSHVATHHTTIQAQSLPTATISNLQIVQDGSDPNWRVGFDWTVTNGPVPVSYTLTNGDTGFLIGQETSETIPDGSSYSGTVFIPFALLNPGQTLTVTATSPDPTVTISGSPLSSTAPIP